MHEGKMHIISLGAGVQSSTMALMAAHGEITPMPDAAIFADTQIEPKSVYEWLDWLEKHLPFPVYRATKGNLGERSLVVRTSKGGKRYTKHAIPAFITDGQSDGLMMRQCTSDFKIEVVDREIRTIRSRAEIVQWIGISIDEADRMKPKMIRRPVRVVKPANLFQAEVEVIEMQWVPHPYITNVWPLIDKGISRKDCFAWMQAKGYPRPPRSACVICPYHSNEEWQRIRDEEPEAFEYAVHYEGALQAAMEKVTGFRGVPFLHRSLMPLSQVDFSKPEGERAFSNECFGMCGV